jgi:hypothetical protein
MKKAAGIALLKEGMVMHPDWVAHCTCRTRTEVERFSCWMPEPDGSLWDLYICKRCGGQAKPKTKGKISALA